MDFAGVKHLTFDCFGTLIDWEAGILKAVRPVLTVHGVRPDDDVILEKYAAIESRLEAGEFIPYREVLRRAMAELGEAYGLTLESREIERLPESISRWPAFPDTANALQRLSTVATINILSNVDADLFEGVQPNLGITPNFIVTADYCRSYKPGTRHFRVGLALLDASPGDVLHVAQSLYHDIPPAKSLGLRTVWVDRRHGKQGGGATPAGPGHAPSQSPDLTVRSLHELALKMGV